MRPRRWGPWLGFAGSLAVAPALLLAALAYGLRVDDVTRLRPLPPSGALDYVSRPSASVAPLSARFVSGALGLSLGGEVAAPVGAPGAPSEETAPVATEAPPRPAPEPQRITDDHPLTNDQLAAARDVTGLPFTARTDTRRASREPREPSDCAPVGSSTVWYRYRPAEDLGLLADTFGTRYAVALAVYRGGDGELAPVGCDTDPRGNAIVAFPAKRGSTYYFQVTGPAGGGELVFNLDRQGKIELASVGADGREMKRQSSSPSISGDGRFVAFVGGVGTVGRDVDHDRCGVDDCRHILVRDRVEGTTVVASRDMAGGSANGVSTRPFVAGGGRYVAFVSSATNLVPGDTNGIRDVFVHDLVAGTTERVSVTSSGEQAAVTVGDVSAVQLADTYDPSPTLSWDGRFVAFDTLVPLVPEDRNGDTDVYVHDRVTRTTERVSVSVTGGDRDGENASCFPAICQGAGTLMVPSISGNGRYVRFNSASSNHVRGDTNRAYDTFVHDRLTGLNERVSVRNDGKEVPGDSNNEFLPRQGFSFDGRYVVFSAAGPLAEDDANGDLPDIYVRDRHAGRTIRVNVSSSGEHAEGHGSRGAAISADGRYVAFHSAAANLSPGDTNEGTDVFVHDLLTRTTRRISVTATGEAGEGAAASPSISFDGSMVAFESLEVYAAPGPTVGVPGRTQVYIHHRPRSVR